jgi:protein SCO1/2
MMSCRPSPPFSRRDMLQAASVAALTCAIPLPASAHNAVGLVKPPVAPPATMLQLHDGRKTTLQDLLKGKVTVLQLMFTGCSATCPIQGALFASTQQKLAALAPAIPGAQMVSISIDPLNDDPKALAAWLQRFGAGPQWLAGVPAMKDVDPWLDFLQGRNKGVDRHTAQVYCFNRRGQLALRTVDFPPALEVVKLLQGLADLG